VWAALRKDLERLSEAHNIPLSPPGSNQKA
jgi:hypothetical protein